MFTSMCVYLAAYVYVNVCVYSVVRPSLSRAKAVGTLRVSRLDPRIGQPEKQRALSLLERALLLTKETYKVKNL